MGAETSRYAKIAPVIDSAGRKIMPVRYRIASPIRPDDRFHTVIEGERIDQIANRYFGDATLWWVICDYNAIQFPLELTPRAVLRIPSNRTIQMRILS